MDSRYIVEKYAAIKSSLWLFSRGLVQFGAVNLFYKITTINASYLIEVQTNVKLGLWASFSFCTINMLSK